MTCRKTPSRYGNFIKEALLHEQPWLKSEDLPEYRRFYVNEKNIIEIHNNCNHLIVGRRGTGKTHLLGSFKEYIEQESSKELAVMVSILEVTPITPPRSDLESPKFSNKKMASLMFDGFLKVVFLRSLDVFTDRLKILKEKRSSSEKKQIHDEVNSLLTQLMEEVEYGSAYHIEKRLTSTSDKEGGGSRGVGGEFSLSAKNLVPSVNASISLNANKGSKRSKKETLQIESLLITDLFKVRELFLRIVDALELDVFYILIDEWMELDKKASSGIQPIFAQFLKTTFFNDKHFSVKIATVWHQTTFYDQDHLDRSKGVQLNHDIVRAIDLDTAFLTTNKEVFEFSKKLLFKRLAYACKDLNPLEGSNGEIDDMFVTEIFDNENNFKMFIAASHGIPRDLMAIFQKCALLIDRNFKEKCIDHNLIFKVARKLYMADKRKNVEVSSPPHRLLSAINSYMDNTGRRLFIIKNGQAVDSKSLKKLADEELIHQIPSAVTPRDICDSHKAYLIDFGNYVDWIKSRKEDISDLLNESVLAYFPDNFRKNISSYEIDVTSVEKDVIECKDKSCKYIFLDNHPVFQKAGICPECANLI